MAERSHCLVCGGTRISALYSAKDYLVSAESFALEKCKDCGFIYTSTPPDEKEIAEYYISEDYISHTDKKRNLTDYAYHLARSFMLKRKHDMVLKINGGKTGSLIDIGSGTGYFAGYMSSKGWTVTGVEISERARKYSVTKFGINVIDPAGISEIKKDSADCITLWHVLEHLYDPGYWMSEIRRILKDNGRCLIALPNINSSDSEWFGSAWAALDVPRHLWHFPPETFRKFINGHGFACSRVRAMPLDVFYISILSYRNRGSRFPLLSGIMTGLLLSIMNLFRKERASSLIYVISKLPR